MADAASTGARPVHRAGVILGLSASAARAQHCGAVHLPLPEHHASHELAAARPPSTVAAVVSPRPGRHPGDAAARGLGLRPVRIEPAGTSLSDAGVGALA